MERSEEAIFAEAIEMSADERAAYLDAVCKDDPELRANVESLLVAYGQGSFLESQPLDRAATIDIPLTEMPGTQISSYKLLQEIGQGGMGVVYMAEQIEPVRRKVALKIIKPGMDTRQVIARFEAERQALSLMDHPNIAKVLDAGATESGRPYFVMELVKGQPITQYCDDKHLTPRERLQMLLPICHAIQHAHQKGIIHRDIKPTNILVAEYDEKPVPKVIDFGVAKAISQPLTEKTMFTGFGQIVGTIEYMSPEQAKVNQLDIDTRSDVYSLGVLMYELLTGTTPFDKERLRMAAWDEMLRIIREEDPPKPSTRLSDFKDSLPSISAQRQTEPARLTKLVRGELDWIVMKALEKDRSRRYETANSFAADVERYLNDEPVLACPPSAGYRLRKLARRNRGRLVAGGVLAVAFLVALGAVGGSVGWAWRDRAARQAMIAGRVDQLLDESAALYQQRKLPEATQIARNALALAEGAAGDPQAARRAQDWLKDLDMVARLEEIHPFDEDNLHPKMVEYPQAFREYGIDLEALIPEEAAARIAARPIRVDLAVALDRWLYYAWNWRHYLGLSNERGAALRARLRQIARLADPNELRDRVRDLYADRENGLSDDQDIRAVADSVDLASTPIATLMVIGDALDSTRRIPFYARVQQRHPSDFGVTFHLGDALFNKGDRDGAIRFLTAAAAIRPQSYYAHGRLGMALGANGQVDEAIAAYRAVDRANGPSIYKFQIGALLLRAGREQEAAAEFREALRLDSNPAGVNTQIGGVYTDVGKYDEAIAAYREAIRLKPDYAHAHHGLGFALEQKGLVDDAIAAHRDAVHFSPRDSPYHQGLGLALCRKGLHDEGFAAQREAIRINPSIVRYHCELGSTLFDAGRWDEAIAAYREAVHLAPQNAVLHYNLGSTLRKKNEIDAAILAFREAIRVMPDYADAHQGLGVLLVRKGLVDETIAAYSEAVRLKPDDSAFRRGLGGALENKGLLIEAIAAHSEAVRLAPNDAEVHLSLGTALQAKGLVDDAIREYRETIRLRPDMAMAHHWLGTALDKKGLLDDAIAAHREAIRLEPNEVHLHGWLGISLQKKGLSDDARAAYREAIRLQPDVPVYHFRLGGVHARLGQWAPAASAYTRGLEIDKNPDNHYTWYTGLPLQLAAGDAEGYRRLCGQMLERFGQSTNLITAEWTAKTCALIPDAVADFKAVERLADQIVKGTENHPSYRFFVLVKALVEYRAGRHAEAVRWMERYAPVADGNEFDAFVFATLSMAQHRLGNADQARAALASAKAIVTHKMPDPANGRPFVAWHEWLQTSIVVFEAEALVKEP